MLSPFFRPPPFLYEKPGMFAFSAKPSRQAWYAAWRSDPGTRTSRRTLQSPRSCCLTVTSSAAAATVTVGPRKSQRQARGPAAAALAQPSAVSVRQRRALGPAAAAVDPVAWSSDAAARCSRFGGAPRVPWHAWPRWWPWLWLQFNCYHWWCSLCGRRGLKAGMSSLLLLWILLTYLCGGVDCFPGWTPD